MQVETLVRAGRQRLVFVEAIVVLVGNNVQRRRWSLAETASSNPAAIPDCIDPTMRPKSRQLENLHLAEDFVAN